MAGNNDQRDRQHGQDADHRSGQRQQSQQGAGERQHNAGNFANDKERASEAGKKGAARTEQQRHQDAAANKQHK